MTTGDIALSIIGFVIVIVVLLAIIQEIPRT